MKRKKNLRKLLNLEYLKVSNKTISVGEKDFPKMFCDIEEYPDFIALYNESGLYHKTERTCVGFFEYDKVFNGRYGFIESIWWNDEEKLYDYAERFEGVRYFCSPDNSVGGDLHKSVNDFRIFQARLASIWLTMNVDAIVIPLITYARETDFQFMLDGLEDVTAVMFNTKGKIDAGIDHELLKLAVSYTVKRLKKLKAIIVYSVTPDNEKIFEMFAPAIEAGIKIVIPDNTLRTRNIELMKARTHHECA